MKDSNELKHKHEPQQHRKNNIKKENDKYCQRGQSLDPPPSHVTIRIDQRGYQDIQHVVC